MGLSRFFCINYSCFWISDRIINRGCDKRYRVMLLFVGGSSCVINWVYGYYYCRRYWKKFRVK